MQSFEAYSHLETEEGGIFSEALEWLKVFCRKDVMLIECVTEAKKNAKSEVNEIYDIKY